MRIGYYLRCGGDCNVTAFQSTVAVTYYATCSNTINKYTFPEYLQTAIIVAYRIDRFGLLLFQARYIRCIKLRLQSARYTPLCLRHYLAAFDAYTGVPQYNILMGNT